MVLIVQRFLSIFKRIFHTKEELTNNIEFEIEDKTLSDDNESSDEEKKENKTKNVLDVIFSCKIKIKRFETIFSDKYLYYNEVLENLENTYIQQKDEFLKSDGCLTVAINPDDDYEFLKNVYETELEIDEFIKNEVIPKIIITRLDKHISQAKKLYLEVLKHSSSKHVKDRVDEAKNKLDEIIDCMNLNDDEEEKRAISQNMDICIKFYEAKYHIAKIIIVSYGIDILEDIFEENERKYYLIHLYNEIDSLKSRLLKFDDGCSYEKLKFDLFDRVANLNFVMPSEKALVTKKFWIDFLSVEKAIFLEERKIQKAGQKLKSKNGKAKVDVSNSDITIDKFKMIKASSAEDSLLEKTSEDDFKNYFIDFIKNRKNEISDIESIFISILSYIEFKVTAEDIYNLLTLFEIRHLYKDEILAINEFILIPLKEEYINKYVASYEKLHQKKQKVLSCSFDEKSDYVVILKFSSDAEDINDIVDKIKGLNIDVTVALKDDNQYILINKIYFKTSSKFLLNLTEKTNNLNLWR